MKNIIVFLFELFIQLTANTTKSNIYSKIMNERAMLGVMKETDARSSMECAAHCTITDGCRRAQWRTFGCELLLDAALSEPIELGYEDETVYMYQQTCGAISCENGGSCVANATGTFCANGYGGSSHERECDASLYNLCFKVYPGSHSWYEAKELCEHDGGRLPEICSIEINDLLEQLMTDHHLYPTWVGYSDEAVETKWEWVTQSCNISSFESWFTSRPIEDTSANCMQIFHGYWFDGSCQNGQNVICEFY